MIDEERRGLFASLSSAIKKEKQREKPVVRPPYNTDPSLFYKLCPDCSDKRCAGVCEEEIIVIDERGTPTLDFSKNGCTFCDACADACDSGVLSDKTLNFVDTTVEIDVLKCVAWHQVLCSSCKDPCLENAIVFLGLFRPEIDMDRCTGCGWCRPVCPADAILFIPPKRRKEA
ncbi:ferredoxin-type protein NapF [Hydrogenimonas urashimensis]|uniref:ferredoxin-type protein NapF n=1 Tax=Hydrogenimonas urashimensis TaxID=2740515 RepID=UPI0019165078|nr:ferredoxin-type protein NapF [Hydrogenimonas urashimensis]